MAVAGACTDLMSRTNYSILPLSFYIISLDAQYLKRTLFSPQKVESRSNVEESAAILTNSRVAYSKNTMKITCIGTLNI